MCHHQDSRSLHNEGPDCLSWDVGQCYEFERRPPIYVGSLKEKIWYWGEFITVPQPVSRTREIILVSIPRRGSTLRDGFIFMAHHSHALTCMHTLLISLFMLRNTIVT